MKIINVDKSKCFNEFFNRYKTILEQKYNCLCGFEIRVFERCSSKLAEYKNNPILDKSYFNSPFMCDLLEVASNKAEIYLVTDFCGTIVEQDSRDALILHEFGHIIFNKLKNAKTYCNEEIYADCIASGIIGPQKMIYVLNEIKKDVRFMTREKDIDKRINSLKTKIGKNCSPIQP